ncbi:MAG: hypothetical protein B6242_01155 [Anaerolineaceae bacterium 4572_78]|nr:MAG: hypothetical protein B6242_01155 [Anaerolineaceae bacterium 4572_78]
MPIFLYFYYPNLPQSNTTGIIIKDLIFLIITIIIATLSMIISDSTSSALSQELQLEEFQSIPTSGAKDWEFFTIDNVSYLAVANRGELYTTSVDSKIYQWNGSSFVEYQSILTYNAWDWEFFTIGSDDYLAVANNNDNSNWNIDSKIYKWNGNSFEEFQSIPTIGGNDWEFFTIDSDDYLAMANYCDGTNTDRDVYSKIYKWNGTNFVEYQSILTTGAQDVEYFVIDNTQYLVVGNYFNGSTRNINSKIYRWNGANFIEFQSILTSGGHDWEFFTIDSNHYLAVANTNNDSASNINSVIYRWDGNSFIEFQSILTQGARDWKFFSIDNNHYLVVANVSDGSTKVINSVIYQWNGSSFTESQLILTNGAEDWEFFTIDNESYLAVANNQNDSTKNVDSKIYKCATESQTPNTPTTTPSQTMTPAPTATPIPVPPGIVPIMLQVEAGHRNIELDWNVTNNAEVTHYRIYRMLRNDGTGSFLNFDIIADNVLETVYFDEDSNLVPKATYCYLVEAMTANDTATVTSSLDLKDFISNVGGSTIYTPDDLFNPVPLILEDGTFYVEETAQYVLGDLNGNGVVQAADALLSLQFAVGQTPPSPPSQEQIFAGDPNGNGIIEAADASMILYYAVHGQWPPIPTTNQKPVRSGETTTIALVDVIGAAGSTIQMTLQATNLHNFAGGQFVVIYDKDVISGISNVTKGDKTTTFNLEFYDDGLGQLRIALADTKQLSGDGNIATISMTLAEDVTVGTNVTLRLADTKLNDLNGRDFITSFADNSLIKESAILSIGETVSEYFIYLPIVLK